jgi:hypothetical protein
VAERASRISHALYWGCLLAPGLVGLWYPGLTHYDPLLGIGRLPLRPVAPAAGLPLLAAGLGLMAAANRALVRIGRGAPAFLLTEQLVALEGGARYAILAVCDAESGERAKENGSDDRRKPCRAEATRIGFR